MTSCKKVGVGWVNSKKNDKVRRGRRSRTSEGVAASQHGAVIKVTLLMLGNFLVVVLVLASWLVFSLYIANTIIGIGASVRRSSGRRSGGRLLAMT